MRHTRFFITGFGPFLPDAPYNPTQALVERLLAEGVVKAADGHANTNCRDFKLDCRVVAVETEAAVEAIEAIAACVKNEYINDECGTDNSRSVLVRAENETCRPHDVFDLHQQINCYMFAAIPSNSLPSHRYISGLIPH